MENTAQPLHWSEDLPAEHLEAQKRFFDTRIRHPKLDAFLQALSPLLTPYSESNIICGVGATGVGKSTVARFLLKTLHNGYSRILDQDPSAIPVVAVEAYETGETRRSFRTLFENILKELLEPGVGKKTLLDSSNGRMQVRSRHQTTIPALRDMVEDALKHRKTVNLVIDEAYHLLRFAKDDDVMDTLKSLSNTTKLKILLIGSFDLLDLVGPHGQVARRTTLVPFERYNLDSKEDRAAFRVIVLALQAKWPCESRPNFAKVSDELLELCLGCVGLLKAFLLDASARQLRNRGQRRPEFLQQAAKSNVLRARILQEIEEGEEKVRDALCGACLWDAKAVTRLSGMMEA
jgi:AAA domain